MKTLKQIVALLLSIAALLASIFSLMDVKRNVERNTCLSDAYNVRIVCFNRA